MKRFVVVGLLVGFAFVDVFAKKLSYTYKSDSIGYRRGAQEVTLKGNVSITLENGKILEAETMTIHEDRAVILAKEQVRFKDEENDMLFEGKSLKYNYGKEEFWSSERALVQKPKDQTTIRGSYFHGKVASNRLVVKTNVIVDSSDPENKYRIYGQEATFDTAKGNMVVSKHAKIVQSNMDAFASRIEHNQSRKRLVLTKKVYIQKLFPGTDIVETVVQAGNVVYDYSSNERYLFKTNVSISNTANSNVLRAGWVETFPEKDVTVARSNASFLNAEEQMFVQASKLEQKPKENVFVATGNVQIQSTDEEDSFVVRGGAAEYNEKKGVMEVETNCSLSQSNMNATSGRLTYNKNTKETWLEDKVDINIVDEEGGDVKTQIQAEQVHRSFLEEKEMYVFKESVWVENKNKQQEITANYMKHFPMEGHTLAETNAHFKDKVELLEVTAESFEQFESQNKFFARKNVKVVSASESDPYTIEGKSLKYEGDLERVEVWGSSLRPCSITRSNMLAKATRLVQDLDTKDIWLETNVSITTFEPETKSKQLSITAERTHRQERQGQIMFEFFEDVYIFNHIEETTVTAGYVKYLPEEDYAFAETKPVLRRREGDVVIKATILEQFGKRDLLYARGDAVITTEKTLSRSLLAIYNRRTKHVLLSGDCYLKSGKSEFISNRIYYSTETGFAELRGVVRGAFQMNRGLFGDAD